MSFPPLPVPLSNIGRRLASAAAIALICAPAAAANTINVTTGDDVTSPGCSLRSAISAANADAAVGGCSAGQGADTIVLHTATYALTKAGRVEDGNATGDLDITSSLTITGDGMSKSIIDANAIDRVMEVFGGNVVVLRDLAITNGSGGGQLDSPSTTETNGSRDVTGNPANLGQDGGGIRSSGNLTLDRVSVQANTAGTAGSGGKAIHTNGRAATGGAGGRGGRGGGIANSGQLLVVDSRIVGNTGGTGGVGGDAFGGPGTSAGAPGGNGNGGSGGSGGSGGGIYTRGTLTVQRTLIDNNRAGRGGSGGGGTGGNGANNTEPSSGGNGGAGNGGTGGPGGSGGGIAFDTTAAGANSVSDSAVTGNLAGNGGPGYAASSGYGGNGGGFYQNNGGASILPPGWGGVATGGRGGYGGSGGGIAELNGDVSLARTTFAGNKAGTGAAGGRATAGASGTGSYHSTSDRSAATGGAGGDGGSGGGIATGGSGVKTLTDSTLDSNATGGGGPGSGTVTGSPANGGSGGGAGGGGALDSHNSPLAIVRSTITASTIGTHGLGALGAADGTTGGASAIWGGTSTRLTASILAENQASRCYGTVEDGGNNIDFPGDPVCPGTAVDPLLKPLANNGGVGQTRALSPASPAIDSVACDPASDERGVPRPIGAKCDAGAYEFAVPKVAGVSATADQNSASLTAQITPYDGSATVAIDWGANASYGSTATQTVSGGVATPSGVTQPLNGLQPGTTYHYRLRATNHAGTTTTADGTFRTADAPGGGSGSGAGSGPGDGGVAPGPGDPGPGDGGGSPPPPLDVTDPAISSVKADPSKFLVGTKKTAVTARARKSRKVKAASKAAVGTKLKFALSEDADVEIAFERKTVGKKGKTRAGKKTCKASRKPPKDRSDRCTLFVEAGTLSRGGDRGSNSIAFSGRLGSHALPLGVYRFIVSASDSAGNDADPVTSKFTILDPADD